MGVFLDLVKSTSENKCVFTVHKYCHCNTNSGFTVAGWLRFQIWGSKESILITVLTKPGNRTFESPEEV